LLAMARGQIVQGLVQVYQALGGGWQIRCQPQAAVPAAPPGEQSGPNTIEQIPAPAQDMQVPAPKDMPVPPPT